MPRHASQCWSKCSPSLQILLYLDSDHRVPSDYAPPLSAADLDALRRIEVRGKRYRRAVGMFQKLERTAAPAAQCSNNIPSYTELKALALSFGVPECDLIDLIHTTPKLLEQYRRVLKAMKKSPVISMSCDK